MLVPLESLLSSLRLVQLESPPFSPPLSFPLSSLQLEPEQEVVPKQQPSS
tara:strand:+ start:100 stop:249 length:150 start_codon:yes stop_codon:yes gene_type:complete